MSCMHHKTVGCCVTNTPGRMAFLIDLAVCATDIHDALVYKVTQPCHINISSALACQLYPAEPKCLHQIIQHCNSSSKQATADVISSMHMQARTAARFGVDVEGVRVDFGRVMQRMRELRARMSANDSAKRFATMGVDVFQVGQAVPCGSLLAAQQVLTDRKVHTMPMCEGMPWSIQGLPNTPAGMNFVMSPLEKCCLAHVCRTH